jgi:hypothetical protein
LDLPCGKVSFHSPERFAGPDHPGIADREHDSEGRIIKHCDSFTENLTLPPEPPREVIDLDPLAELDTDFWQVG